METMLKFHPQRFKELRKEMFPSQYKFVDALRERFGISVRQSHISGIESGNTLPALELFIASVALLETNPGYLLGFTDDVEPASDQEDQVVATARSEQEKVVLQEILELLRGKPIEEQKFVLDLVKRLLGNDKPPRIIGR